MNRKEVIIPFVKLAWELLFDSDCEDSDEEWISERRVLLKNMGFWEKTVPLFDDQQFKGHFRISPETFEVILRELLDIDSRSSEVRAGRPLIPIEKQILITLWYVANTECFRSVADRFGVSTTACWTAIFSVCNNILVLNREKKVIAWPTPQEAERTATYFLRKHRFPGVIGSIDGSHIPIPAPKIHPESYINRKKYHSVLLQAVCNEDMIFTNCYTGEAGSIHDSCMFRRSNLYKSIVDASLPIPYDQHILGDQGYGLKPYLLIPFKNNGHLSEGQKNYNQILSSIRVVIERAFGLLKNRFRRLYGLQTKKPEFIPLLIMTACILHNFCLKRGDFFENNFEHENENNIAVAEQHQDPQGQLKRNTIVQQLSL